MATHKQTVYQILILVMLNIMDVNSMSDITQHLLTPLKEEGEACGYESCPILKMNALNVHVVPSTQGELGYTRTFESHFTGREDVYDVSNINMKRILDFVITELWKDPMRKFTFTDIPYLYKWWKIRNPTVHRMFYQLLRQGRIHIVGGGWSMTEESSANYHAIIDHFTFSLRKLNNTFLSCARPYVSWQSDVFGHTSEFASLMAQMGFDGHFINPISYDDELDRMRSKRLEFLWRGSPDLGASSDIFTHKLFDGYWAPPGFCFGGQCRDPLIVSTDSVMNNVEERVKLFIEAMKYRQAPHYATNHIMIVMGQRFGYYDAKMWFDNIEKLMIGVRQYGEREGVEVLPYYSTPICYLKAVYESNITLNLETDDFVPVAYDKKTHFAGLFSSRPTLKYAVRIGHLYLQITKQLQVLGRLKEYSDFFEDFHWIVGVMQDRNILSGAMRPYVRDYYINKLHQSLKSSEYVIKDGITHLLKSPGNVHYSRCLFNISYCEYTDRDNYHIVIYNPLAWPVRVPVRLPCMTNSQYSVYGPKSEKIKSVVIPIATSIKRIPNPKTGRNFGYELIFFAENVPPLGLQSYYIEKVKRTKRSVKLLGIDKTIDSKLQKHKNIDNALNKDTSKIVNEDTTIASQITILKDIISEFRKDMAVIEAYEKDNATADVTKKETIFENNNKLYSKRDVDGSYVDLEKIRKTFRSLLKKHKNAKKSDEIPKTAKNLKKYLKYNLRISLLEKEINRRLSEIEKKGLNKDKYYVTDNDSIQKKITIIPYLEEKHMFDIPFKNKRYVPIYKEERNTNNALDKNIITDKDKDITLDQYVIPLKEKRKLVNEIKWKDTNNLVRERKKIKFSNEEFTNETNNNIKFNLNKIILIPTGDKKVRRKKYSCKKNRHFYKKLRLKRMASDFNNVDKNNSKFIPQASSNTNDILIPNKMQDAQSNSPTKNMYEELDSFMPNKTYGWKDSYPSNKTFKGKDNIPDKTDIKEFPDKTSEEDIFTDQFDFTYRPQNTTLIIKTSSNSTNVKIRKPLEIGPTRVMKMTEAPIHVLSSTTHLSKTARPERSLIKKIKNAKKKYLRRQTSNLKIDDESLLRNTNYDDEDEDASLEYDENAVTDKNVTEADEVVRPLKVEHIPIVTRVHTTTVGTTHRPSTSSTVRTTTSTSTKAPIEDNKEFERSKDNYIGNEYIHIFLGKSRRISHIRLANGVTVSLAIKFCYYASDDPLKLFRPHDKKPGAYVFKPMDNEPVVIDEKVTVEVLKSELVEEIHFTGTLISYIVRLYKDMPYFELTWICSEIPVADEIGKDIFVRYQTDLATGGIFYTDSNGRQTMRRVYGQRTNYVPSDPTSIPGNYYPVTSKITIEDTQKLIRFSVFNDRTQGGTSSNGEIDLMLNRRILTDDAGIQAFLNETDTVLGKHYFYITKLNSKPNRIFEKKLEKELSLQPQIFVPNKVLAKSNWDGLNKHFKGINKKIPIGLNIVTLQAWNEGTLLLRIENYLEKSDVIKSGIKKLVLKDLFSRFVIKGVKETTLDGNKWLKDYVPLYWRVKEGTNQNDVSEVLKEVNEEDEIEFRPQQIRTFVIRVAYK